MRHVWTTRLVIIIGCLLLAACLLFGLAGT